jgi:hypothetical protein
MPGGHGATLLRDIRHDPHLKSRQVVLMSGRSDLLMTSKGTEERADAFPLKPASLKKSVSCVAARFGHA